MPPLLWILLHRSTRPHSMLPCGLNAKLLPVLLCKASGLPTWKAGDNKQPPKGLLVVRPLSSKDVVMRFSPPFMDFRLCIPNASNNSGVCRITVAGLTIMLPVRQWILLMALPYGIPFWGHLDFRPALHVGGLTVCTLALLIPATSPSFVPLLLLLVKFLMLCWLRSDFLNSGWPRCDLHIGLINTPLIERWSFVRLLDHLLPLLKPFCIKCMARLRPLMKTKVLWFCVLRPLCGVICPSGLVAPPICYPRRVG